MPRSAAAIQASLDTWYAARDAIAISQSYTIEGQVVTKADLRAINDTIGRLEAELGAAKQIASTGAAFPFRRGKLTGMGY